MNVYVLALTESERMVVRRALDVYEPRRGEKRRRASILELLDRAPPVANTDNYATTSQEDS